MLDHNTAQSGVEAGLYPPEDRVRELEGRLQRGWAIIEAEEAKGAPTDHLVDHFLNLLAQYEAACDLVRAA